MEGTEVSTAGEAAAALTVTNTGRARRRGGGPALPARSGGVRGPPVQRLIGYARVPLRAGESARVRFTVPADLASFTGVDGQRRVEPGELELRFGASSTDIRLSTGITLTGPVRSVDHTRRLHCVTEVGPVEAGPVDVTAP